MSIAYNYKGALQSDNKDAWNLCADSTREVDGETLTGSIQFGVLILQKSPNGRDWENAVNPVCNLLDGKESCTVNFYTSSGEELTQGTYYRLIFAYQTCKRTSTEHFLFWDWDEFLYKSHAQVYTFFLLDNTLPLSLHNLSVSASDFPTDDYDISLLLKGETLVQNSTTTEGFKIDKLNYHYFTEIWKDGQMISSFSENDDGKEFRENGRYTIKSCTKLGKQSTVTVYVFRDTANKGFDTYFDEYILDGERVFRYSDYPTYARDAAVHLKNVSEYAPALSGEIYCKTTSSVLKKFTNNRAQQDIHLDPGEYTVTLYNGNPNAGSYYKYQFEFEVIDELSKPFVNLDNLQKTQRVSDLKSKHYEVTYQTTAGGYIFVCFPIENYQDAFSYAYEIEKRFVENAGDGYYYKSKDNPNKKIKYYDYVALTEALNFYAQQNVEVN